MLDNPNAFNMPLVELGWQDWLEKADKIVTQEGYVEPLGDDHAAIFVEESKTLLVTFENQTRLSELSENNHPLGWEMVKALGWSHLCMLSHGDTWFRDNRVYAYFDRLIDDGFFDDFEQVIFYGAGPCGYAAAAYSVAAPHSKVLLLQPQATLDPRVAEWDDRFLHMRRVAFDDRYGYAPDMLDAAQKALVIYDPEIELDAMHAALFTRHNVTKFRMRYFGSDLETNLFEMNVLLRILAQLSADTLTLTSLGKLYRARRKYAKYQLNFLKRLINIERHSFSEVLCRNVLDQRPNARFFQRNLKRALFQQKLASQG